MTSVTLDLLNFKQQPSVIIWHDFFSEIFLEHYFNGKYQKIIKTWEFLIKNTSMNRLLVIICNLFVIGQGFKIDPRIINGVKSNVSEFPFYVHLDMEQSTCGGSLISDR